MEVDLSLILDTIFCFVLFYTQIVHTQGWSFRVFPGW